MFNRVHFAKSIRTDQRGFVLLKMIFLLMVVAGIFWMANTVKKPSWKVPDFNKSDLFNFTKPSANGSGVEYSLEPVANQGKYYRDYKGKK